MYYRNIPQPSLINSIIFQNQINPIINFNGYYPNYNFNTYLIQQNYNKYPKKRLFYKKNNFNYSTKKIYDDENINEANFLSKTEKEEEKFNSIKINNKRRTSLDTTISSISHNFSSNDEEETEKLSLVSNSKSDEKKEIEIKDNNYTKYEGNSINENTEILRVKVKIAKDKEVVFKLKRYDDVFETIKIFCEINSIDEKLIKPLIMKSLSTLNTIYQIMNSKLDEQEINILKKIKNM